MVQLLLLDNHNNRIYLSHYLLYQFMMGVAPSGRRSDRLWCLAYSQCGASSASPIGPNMQPSEFSRVGE